MSPEQFEAAPVMCTDGLLAIVVWGLIRHWRRPGRLTPPQVHTLQSQDVPPLVIDVRSPEEFAGELGHVDGAVLLPLPELEGRLSELVPHRGRPIVTV